MDAIPKLREMADAPNLVGTQRGIVLVAAQHIEQLQSQLTAEKEKNRWIPVGEGLPDYEVEVLALCYESGDCIIRQLDYSSDWRNCHGVKYKYNVTHWRSIDLLEGAISNE